MESYGYCITFFNVCNPFNLDLLSGGSAASSISLLSFLKTNSTPQRERDAAEVRIERVIAIITQFLLTLESNNLIFQLTLSASPK